MPDDETDRQPGARAPGREQGNDRRDDLCLGFEESGKPRRGLLTSSLLTSAVHTNGLASWLYAARYSSIAEMRSGTKIMVKIGRARAALEAAE